MGEVLTGSHGGVSGAKLLVRGAVQLTSEGNIDLCDLPTDNGRYIIAVVMPHPSQNLNVVNCALYNVENNYAFEVIGMQDRGWNGCLVTNNTTRKIQWHGVSYALGLVSFEMYQLKYL